MEFRFHSVNPSGECTVIHEIVRNVVKEEGGEGVQPDFGKIETDHRYTVKS